MAAALIRRPWLMTALATAVTVAVTGCNVAPKYQKPEAILAPSWQLEQPWREAVPKDAMIKGNWWEMFNDPVLSSLAEQALRDSQTLQIAAVRLRQARTVVDLTSAGLVPTVQLTGSANRSKISADRPVTNYATQSVSTVQNDVRLGFVVNYEIDLVGRIRTQIEGVQAGYQQSQADFQNARLLLTSDVAGNYFNLRALDSDISVLRQGIELQRRALELANTRYELGASSGLDQAQQQATLETTLTQLELQLRQRKQFETALATLTGKPAPFFSLAAQVLKDLPPPIPIGLPSDLLERRPDVASAERAMAVANAQIGVAKAAFYPSLPLSGALGYEATSFANLLNASSVLWSLGANVAQVVFDGGRLKANLAITQAGYDGTVAQYRQTVLVAMQEVENGITGLSALERAAATAQAAVRSSERVLQLANDRYAGGLTTYLDVITAQQALLNNQRQAAQILGQRQITSVFLIKALGGGWT